MRILHVIYVFAIGGAETMLADIINRQVEFAEVALCVINDKLDNSLLEILDKRVKRILIKRKEGSKNPLKLFQINYEILRFQPDIIHSHQDTIVKGILPIFRNKVLTVHDIGISLQYTNQYKAICSISKSVQKDIETRQNIKSKLVYNGIDVSKVKQRSDSFKKVDVFRILQVSRLMHEKKGQDILIRAIHQLKQELPDIRICLDLIGSGPSEAYLRNLSRECGLENSIRFLGEKNRIDIYDSIADYHLLAQPSLYEGFGLTVIEGLAAKVPVLSSDNDGPEEILQSGKYGFLFKNGSVEDCCVKIKEIFSNYDSLYPMLEDAHTYVKDNFDISHTVKAYLNVYKKVLGN